MDRSAKVVIAGGSGFIGTPLAVELSTAGYDVVVLSRSPAGVPGSGNGPVRTVRWTPDQPGAWQQALSGARAVINLCGAGIGDRRWTARRKRELIDSRVVPSRALVAACRALPQPPEVFLQASGVGYYGSHPAGDHTAAEDDPPGDDFLARLAVAWEAPLEDAPARTVALRFGVVLARRGGALPRMLLPFHLFAGGPVAGGRQWLSWIHIADAIAAVRFALERPLVGAVNVTAPEPVRNAEFAATAGAALGRPAVLPLPRFVLQAALGEQATLVCDGQRALPARLEKAGFAFRFRGLRAALTDLCS